MEVENIVAELDREILRLQEARALLGGAPTKTRSTARKKTATARSTGKKRKLTPEGRKRIAEAMTRRWAERKKQAASKTAK